MVSICAAYPAQGAGEWGRDLDTSEVEWFRACGRGRDYHLGRDVIDRHHERWRHRDAVWRQEVMHSRSDLAQSFLRRGAVPVALRSKCLQLRPCAWHICYGFGSLS